MVCGAAASVLKQRRTPLANLSQSRVMCFFSRLVSLGMFSWLLRFKACSFELFDRHVFNRWAMAASTVSSQPYMKKPIRNLCNDDNEQSGHFTSTRLCRRLSVHVQASEKNMVSSILQTKMVLNSISVSCLTLTKLTNSSWLILQWLGWLNEMVYEKHLALWQVPSKR
jgi:hypothetical protein